MGSTLQSQLEGSVLVGGDEGYDAARAVWNGMVDRRPRYIARCASVADVVAAVRFAQEQGLELGIRCGGHGTVGHAGADDRVVLRLRLLGGGEIHPPRLQARGE